MIFRIPTRVFAPAVRISLLALSLHTGLAVPASTNMLGFTASHALAQRTLEKQFDSKIDPADQSAWLERMSSEPNHVGSPHDKQNAEFILAKFKEWGWDARIETFYVLYPTPQKIAVEMVAPTSFKARLEEPALDGDRTSKSTASALPPYHAYGGDGDVTADLIYVNQGMPDDYIDLDRRGISVKDKIIIARYGGGWRGLKPKLAREHGAIGCLIYSDPHDDGYGAGDVYPKGGFRPADGVQRGSVLDLPISPGDPLTPGAGATKDATRLSLENAKTLLKIPVLPISYADALPLLSALGGPVAPAGWRGGLAITYHIGPGPAKVHLMVQSEWTQKPIYDVIAMIRGGQYPDQWVMRGNHHDGWVFGAWDPLSANAAMLSEAKAIGALLKDGWRPKRTLVYASWDGEEPGLLGSTEWVETHADELAAKLVLYVNSDTNGRGFLRAGGSHSFQSLVNQVASEVVDPQTGVSVLERLRAKILVEGNERGGDEEDKRSAKKISNGSPPPISALGSGSDYSPFLQHAGIASLDIRYGGEDNDFGIYHSVYDSFDHFIRFGDPGFVYGAALSKTIGRVMLRVADADILPMRCVDFSETVADYIDELHKLADGMRERTEQRNHLLEENAFQLAADPTETIHPPRRESSVPFLNFAPLDNALVLLKKRTKLWDQAALRMLLPEFKPNEGKFDSVNILLKDLEQTLIYSKGLPGREWYRHMIYAPGLHTGYGVKTLPSVREAIEERRWSEANQYIPIIASVLNAYGEQLDRATAAGK